MTKTEEEKLYELEKAKLVAIKNSAVEALARPERFDLTLVVNTIRQITQLRSATEVFEVVIPMKGYL